MSKHLCDTCAPDKPNCGLSECDHKPRKQTNFERITRSPESLADSTRVNPPHFTTCCACFVPKRWCEKHSKSSWTCPKTRRKWLDQEAVIGNE